MILHKSLLLLGFLFSQFGLRNCASIWSWWNPGTCEYKTWPENKFLNMKTCGAKFNRARSSSDLYPWARRAPNTLRAFNCSRRCFLIFFSALKRMIGILALLVERCQEKSLSLESKIFLREDHVRTHTTKHQHQEGRKGGRRRRRGREGAGRSLI